jgi:hypothetical protein
VRDPLVDPLEALTLPPVIGVVGERWSVERRVTTVGPALGGREQRVISPLSVWRATLSLEAAQGDVEAWEALLERHGAGRRPALLGPLLSRFPSRGVLGAEATFTDATTYTDGVGHAEGGGPVTVSLAAPAGQRWILVAGAGVALRAKPGRYFSIGARMFRATVISAAQSDDAAVVEFEPPLPWAVPAGRELDERPHARMRLVAADEAGPARRGRATRLTWSSEWVEVPARTGLGGALGAMRTEWA